MITRDEWLSALGEAQAHDPEAMTVTEIAAMLGVGRQAAQRRATEMVKAGKAAQTTKIINKAGGYGRVVVPAYRLLKKKK